MILNLLGFLFLVLIADACIAFAILLIDMDAVPDTWVPGAGLLSLWRVWTR